MQNYLLINTFNLKTSLFVFLIFSLTFSCQGQDCKELNSDFTGFDDTGLEFKYQIKDSILTLGNRSYIVEELTKTELVIRNYDPNGISLSNFRTKFRKQE